MSTTTKTSTEDTNTAAEKRNERAAIKRYGADWPKVKAYIESNAYGQYYKPISDSTARTRAEKHELGIEGAANLARNILTSELALDICIDYVDTGIQALAGANPGAGSDTLHRLVSGSRKNHRTIRAVAGNPMCPPGLLDIISRGQVYVWDEAIGEAVSRNPNTSRLTLLGLIADRYSSDEEENGFLKFPHYDSQDSYSNVLRLAASNPTLTREDILALRTDDCDGFHIRRSLKNYYLHERFERIIAGLFENPNFPGDVASDLSRESYEGFLRRDAINRPTF